MRETQRAFVYFSLYGVTIDRIIVNRVIPAAVQDVFFENWRASQQKTLQEIEQYFAPVPVRQVPLFSQEIFGYDRLKEFALSLYPEREDPSAAARTGAPYSFAKVGDHHEVRLEVPFTEKAEIGLFKKDDELVIEIGTIRRHVGLPTTMAALQPTKARLEGRTLIVEMRQMA
jgi:arsenite/tail-anchored protein-transporting ATPase